MHSFLRVVETLAEDGDCGPFLISTVDTIAAPGAFGAFAAASRESDADVILAVTPPTDDDKPLLVRVGSDGATVEAIGEAVRLEPDTSAAGAVGTVSSARRPPPRDHLVDRDARQARPRSGIWATAGYYAVRSSVLREAERGQTRRRRRAAAVFRTAPGARLPSACGAGGLRDRRRPPGGRPRSGDISEAGRSVMRLIGLYREAECSPGEHRSNDAHLLELVGQALRARGFRVDLMTLAEAARSRRSATMVFSMCQGRGCARPADALGARRHAPDQQPPRGAEHVPRSASGDSAGGRRSGFRRRRSSRPRAATIRRSR